MVAATTVVDEGDGGAATGAHPWRVEAERVVRVAAGGLMGGLLAGALVAGVGGRIAMRVVALQSPDGYQGLTTDDGAATGEITLTGSLGLIAFLALVGGLGGLVYAVVRDTLPARRRPLIWGLATGLVVGSMVISADGVDYTVLGQRWVSAAMFGAISAGYGALAAHVTERVLRPDGLARRARTGWMALPYMPMLAGLTIVPLAVVLAGVTTVRASGLAARIPTRAVVLAVRVALALAVVAAGVTLVRTLAELA